MATLARTKMLIIEGSSPLRARLKSLFSERGFKVTALASPEKGIHELTVHHFDIALTRCVATGTKGLKILLDGKLLRPDSIFILMASHVTSEGAIMALRAGAADLLREPFTDTNVLEAVETALIPKRDAINARRMFCCLKREEREFMFPSDEAAIGPAVDLLVENLYRAGVCTQMETRLVAMALTEAIANAVYHGNLTISPHLKIHLSNEEFSKEISRRMACEKTKSRKIHIKYAITPNEARYVISDDGKGFDYKGALAVAAPSDRDRSGGRGLFLLKKIMDEVTYNEKGNEVTLIKRARRKQAGA
ncbi:MAG: ATP-binding protein [Nitrospinae bacterium]|nr:ATP-binding protein [Nitrospinota bacterium]